MLLKRLVRNKRRLREAQADAAAIGAVGFAFKQSFVAEPLDQPCNLDLVMAGVLHQIAGRCRGMSCEKGQHLFTA